MFKDYKTKESRMSQYYNYSASKGAKWYALAFVVMIVLMVAGFFGQIIG